MSTIYLDLPVGAGFSFTENEDAYPKTLEDISSSVMEFLRQFMLLFPEYVCRDFYVAGESYGVGKGQRKQHKNLARCGTFLQFGAD
ncbi:hypothetical protein HPB52_016170 [Rhipicephalus sanguineus]|uniref:Uncharacterized protein n=1 Tax=Rhipicephalus sanguineus TaxID=34632 RepID=A0A9D4T7Q5_RHISA|nr:hypothetical protein HPB52_016170 [Rhipicephalus sanguineus]